MSGISSYELSEWMVYAELEPFGEERADLRAGIVASTIANIFRGKRRARKPQDFLPKFARKRKQSAGEMLAFFKALDKRLNDNHR